MKQNNIAKRLRWMTIGVAVLGLITCFALIPFIGNELISQKGEIYRDWYYPWLFLCWAVAAPCYYILFQFWGIVKEIGNDNAFCRENVERLKKISQSAILAFVILFLGNTIYFIKGWNQLGSFLLCMVIACAGFVLSVLSSALSHLVYKAVVLQEESELTI